MKLYQFLILLLISTILFNCSSTLDLKMTPIALINNVSFKNSKFNNSNASNGFLIKHNGNIYALTAKHILMIAKTDKMNFVDFEGELEEWRMHPKNDITSYVLTDRLLNVNQKDSLTWDYVGSNWDTLDDWLVFSVKENNSEHKPLKIREADLTDGEKLYAIGWTYSDTVGTQRVYEYTFDKTEGNFHNLIQVEGPKNMGGLSGSPVVDEKGAVVGLVSSGWEDEENNQMILQATTTKNIVEYLNGL